MRPKPVTSAMLTLLAPFAWAGPTQTTPIQQVQEIGHRALLQNPDLEFHPSSILVQFETGTPELARQRARQIVHASVVRSYHIVPGLEQWAISMDVPQAIALVSAMPGVEFAEPDFVQHAINTPNDQFIGLQWGINNTGQSIRGVNGVPDADIDGFEAWDTFTGDQNFVIAVIDTGTQWDHPDLDANIWNNPAEVVNGVDDDGNGFVDDVRGWDFFDNDNNPTDSDGHGTHTAGTIGAEGNNSIGVAGVNWQCKIMPLRFLGPNGGFTSDAIAAVQYATDMGVKVSNNSWGGGGFSSGLYNAINASKAVGHIFVAAAGNSGQNTDSNPHYPSSYDLDNIIAVAATDNRDQLASFSNYGANSVDLGAPGVDIASTYTGSNYVWLSGTSMAAPHVAGVVALVYAQNPSWTYQQVRDRILSTTRPIAALAGRTVTGGMLNANDALAGGGGGGGGGGGDNTAPTVSITSPANGDTFTEGDTITFTGSASDAEDGSLSAEITWTSDIQGALGTGASFSRNDLIVGVHTVTASVTDTGGLEGIDTISITIEAAPPPPAEPPARPGRPELRNLGGGSVEISWADNSNNETFFEIQRQERAGRRWTNTTIVGTTAADVTTFIDTPGNGKWRYRVRAGNDAGVSKWSRWRAIRLR